MVKVIIERRIMPGLEEEYEQAARQAMRVSLGVRGFVGGETLVKIGQPDRRLMITKWRDLRAWNEWHQSEARADAMARILPLLTEDETVQIFESVS
ncbi:MULTISPECIES: antibiotic biosynthesis monooxygenase family protein [unclassified Vreelandella]